MSSLGDTFADRRRSLGISIEQASDATKIRSQLLRSLEDGAYEALPAPGYVRGYVSSYARFLGLDPVPLLSMYKAESGASRLPELDLPQIDEAVARTGEQHAIPWRAAITIVVAVALLALAVWMGARIMQGPDSTPPAPPPAEVPAPAADVTTDQPSGADSDADGAPETPGAEEAATVPFTLGVAVAADGASWLLVTVDGKKAYEGTLTGGQSKRFEVASEASVRVGRPSAVTITRDGEQVDIPEGDTPVVDVTAAPEE